MSEYINKRLEELSQGIFRKQKIDVMIEDLQNDRSYLELRIAPLKDKLDKENADVQKLENKSISLIFYSFLNNLDKRKEKEKSKALAAKLKYDQAARELEDVVYEITKLASEREQYIGYELEYQKLFKEKKDILINLNNASSQKLLDLNARFLSSKNNLKEIKEAADVGSKVITCLNNALKSLDSAEGWGVWDMLGGGLIADLAKHSHIDDAKSEAEKIQSLLRSFKTELADVKINNNIIFETDGFGKFADFFFDGLIADWCMQSKIENSKESVSRVLDNVNEVMSKLNIMATKELTNKNAIEQEIDNLITGA